MGWFNNTVYTNACSEWWGYFKNAVTTTNLRNACLVAAGQCSNSTPIRIYGDTSWYGYAWT